MLTSPMLSLVLTQLHDLLQQTQGEVYFVGGCVRDLLMGRPLHDLDLVAAGDALGLARLAARSLHAAFVLLDEENGIARAVLRGREDSPGSTIDFARMRGPNLQADLAARDLTINAIAMTPAAFVAFARGESAAPQLLDPLGGEADIRAGRLRAASPQAFADDPLRTLRAVRFAGELGFDIEPTTAQWIHRSVSLLSHISPERVRDELTRLLNCPHAAPYLPLLDSLSLLRHVLPELESARADPGLSHLWETVAALEWLAASLEETPEEGHDAPLWQPAARSAAPDLALPLPYPTQLRRHLGESVAGGRPRLTLLKMAALLHHCGQDRDPVLTARSAALRLRLSSREALELSTATGFGSTLAGAAGGEVVRREIYRFYRDTGRIGTGMLLLSLADTLASAGPGLDKQRWDRQVQRVSAILTTYYERFAEVIDPPRLIDGTDLMAAFHMPPGPRIGEILEAIREAQAAGEVHTRDGALDWARRALERAPPDGSPGPRA